MIETITYGVTAAIAILIPGLYIYKNTKQKQQAERRLHESVSKGLTEPLSLHPVIDPTKCIGTAACVPPCPEGEILGVLNGSAKLVSPTKCIGHGACEAACPVEAISLVFGTERRGVELPFLKPNFETNVPGIFIAGELGGMGLIRNAVTQGCEALDYMNETIQTHPSDVYDVAIIGAGPAGLSASLEAQKLGLRSITLEQDDIGGTILSYPRQKLVMTQPMEIPLYGKVKVREIVKEDLLSLWHDVIRKTGLNIHTKERVESVQRSNGYFTVTTTQNQWRAQRVLLAIGRRGTPRKLGVPGEKSSKVVYRLLEPAQYLKKKILVVGGGDSAIEAALALAEQRGTDVTLSYRKNVFSRIKEKNQQRIENAMRQDRVNVLLESNVLEIQREHVRLTRGDEQFELKNDYVFIFIGGVLPTAFLQKMGVSIVKKFGER